MRNTCLTAMALTVMAFSTQAGAICGYVDRADTRYFTSTSQVIVARDGPRTVMSVLYDNRADVRDFALVIPVPQVLRAGQVNIGDRAVFDRLDAYSAPRLAHILKTLHAIPLPASGAPRMQVRACSLRRSRESSVRGRSA